MFYKITEVAATLPGRRKLLCRIEFTLSGRNIVGKDGAQERTRTFTAVKPLAPEASASTNSTTWACRLGHGGGYYGSVTPLSIHA